ncbi:MAG: hypothetical protein RLZZ393_1092 [Pseudomonadota bacterium]|jgi:periplasmic divalent cation tolerance protein
MDATDTRQPILVVTTVATRDQARRLAQSLVEAGLAACAQLSDIESIYAWQGGVQREPEVRLLLKTVAGRYDEVECALRARHPYALPAIFAVPVTRAFGDYIDWIREETA